MFLGLAVAAVWLLRRSWHLQTQLASLQEKAGQAASNVDSMPYGSSANGDVIGSSARHDPEVGRVMHACMHAFSCAAPLL